MGKNNFMYNSNSKQGKSVVVLSFDDGRGDQLRTAEYLQEQRVPAVFNITTGYLAGKCEKLTTILPMSKEDVQWIARQPEFEIAIHGNMHENSVKDIIKGRIKLQELLQLDSEDKLIGNLLLREFCTIHFGFASPESKMPVLFIKRHEKQLKKIGLLYVRTGSAVRTFRTLRVLCRKVGRLIHLPFLYRITYEESLVDKAEKFCFTSIPIMADTTLREVEALIDLAVRRDKICVLMFHSILDKGEKGYKELWTWDRDKFKCLVQYLKIRQDKGDLSVMNIRQHLELRV